MGFIKIIEEKNPIEMHNKVYEASKNNALTPEFCMEVLSHTNVPVIMGKILEEIGKLPIEEQGQYIEVILSMFDGRQTSEKVKNKALEVAKNNGFESELNKVIKETGEGGYSARNGVRDEMYVFDKAGDYSEVDFSSYKGVIVKGEIEEKIKLNTNNSLKGVLDLRGGKNIDLRDCDLSKVTKIIFEEEAEVSLWKATNLPKDLDLSMCDEVSLVGCDLKGIKLKFKEGAVVYLAYANNLPTNLDVSMCDMVNLRGSDLEGINLKFREGARVSLSEAKNLPSNLDLSMCDKVDLSECDLDGLNLKFKEGARVHLNQGIKLPSNLDVSMCEYVNMKGVDISNIKELKFKNEAHIRRSLIEIPEGWKGKIIYTDDEKLAPVISKGNDGR